MMKNRRKLSLFEKLNIVLMLLIIFLSLAPYLHIVVKSFSDQKHLALNDITLYPQGFNLDTHQIIVSDNISG